MTNVAVPKAVGLEPNMEALGGVVEVDSPLKGAHQHRNLALAMAAAVELAETHGFAVSAVAIEKGIRETRWPARLERLTQGGVAWILDVAHNPAGAWALRAGLNSQPGGERPGMLIFSCLRDKPVDEMAQILFPLFDEVIVAPIHSSRAASMESLLKAAEATGTRAVQAESVPAALEMARQQLSKAGREPGVVVISGSVYLVGEARTLLINAGGMAP